MASSMGGAILGKLASSESQESRSTLLECCQEPAARPVSPSHDPSSTGRTLPSAAHTSLPSSTSLALTHICTTMRKSLPE
ncbi:hypothetical protein E2C01_015691 [Portunus trituberculatus]|uniref:Uncharacterized protein n=1 Tax=Portunus trituberculatus TaxID=210409 RepID=A0A5B7DMI5_PORTR|nr:hypothetical protein [Portunus trituberculatus]